MTIYRTPWIDDDGSGTTGSVINNNWKTELYNQIDFDPQPWTDLVNTGTTYFDQNTPSNWYVPTAVTRYTVKGKWASISVAITNSQLFVASYYLGIRDWPFTFKTATNLWIPAVTSHSAGAGTWGPCLLTLQPTYLDFRKMTFGNWAATGADFILSCNILVEIV